MGLPAAIALLDSCHTKHKRAVPSCMRDGRCILRYQQCLTSRELLLLRRETADYH